MENRNARISYLRAITPEEELEERWDRFEQIQTGTIFYLGEVEGERYFLAVYKINDTSWEVIELNRRNRLQIVNNLPVWHTILTFDQMHCLNVPRQDP